MSQKTHFGNKTVKVEDKQKLVDQVFDSSAWRYDLMNDLMSAGWHRLWKEQAIKQLQLTKDSVVCDVAAGTGDLTDLILASAHHVYMTDINPKMLNLGYNRILDQNINSMRVTPVLANGEQLPFASGSFDRLICGFGIRNMTDIKQALSEFRRCLTIGGRLVVLEFARLKPGPINDLYQLYSTHVIPNLGAIFAKDRDSYKYLIESIRQHPDQETFANFMREVGFSDVAWQNQSFGVVSIHVGVKL